MNTIGITTGGANVEQTTVLAMLAIVPARTPPICAVRIFVKDLSHLESNSSFPFCLISSLPHILILLSKEPDTMFHLESNSSSPFCLISSLPHILIFLYSEPDTMFPSGNTATEVTLSVCPSKVRRQSPVF